MDFVDRTKAAGHGRLFPELRRDSRGYYSKDVQRWFARFLKGRGIEGMGFHNFRHGFADRLRVAGVPKDRRDALGGWADPSIGAHYGDGFSPTMKAEDIARVTYPGLDLSHL
jgi:integrase